MRMNLGIRRRLAPLLDNDRRRIELMNGMLMSLPGTPIIYYGDEIGMGDNVNLGDRNGVRTPMQWDGGWNGGFSSADPENALFPDHAESGVRISGDQCAIAEALRTLAAFLDEAADQSPKIDAGIRAGIDRISLSCKSSGAGLCAAAWDGRRFWW